MSVDGECNDGDIRRWTADFFDPLNDDDPADPERVAFVFGPEGGTQTTWIYGTDDELVKDAVSKYHADVDTTGTTPPGGKTYVVGQFYGNANDDGTLQVSGYAKLRVMGNPTENPFP